MNTASCGWSGNEEPSEGSGRSPEPGLSFTVSVSARRRPARVLESTRATSARAGIASSVSPPASSRRSERLIPSRYS